MYVLNISAFHGSLHRHEPYLHASYAGSSAQVKNAFQNAFKNCDLENGESVLRKVLFIDLEVRLQCSSFSWGNAVRSANSE